MLSETCLHQLVERQAVRTPDGIALIETGSGFGQIHVTYGQLNSRADSLSRHLRAMGVGEESRVGLHLARSNSMIIGMLAVLKAGGCYVPLDPDYPLKRIEYIVQDSDVVLTLTDSDDCPFDAIQFSAVPNHSDELSELVEDDAAIDAQNLAYIIYTSGSTGQPKGVAIEHRNVVAMLNWAKDAFDSEDLRCVLASTSMCFDLSIFEIFLPLSVGAECAVIEDILQLNTSSVRHRISMINTVPSAIKALLIQESVPDNVRAVNLAGERLSSDLVDQLLQDTAIKAVHDLYGPSETTTYSTFATRQLKGRETVGQPILGTAIYIMDNDQPALDGIAGELHIGGAGVSRGYLNRPGLTASRFLPDVASSVPGARLYQTGDVARFFDDGNIEYLGRVDHQVKIHGYRVELGEVEDVLTRHEEVSSAVVNTHENSEGSKQLVAYVVRQTVSDAVEEGVRSSDSDDASELVEQWHQIYDADLYGENSTPEYNPDFIDCFDGWLSSYDRAPIPLEEMRIWADLIVERVTRIAPKTILELGCGVGLLLNRLLPHCEKYVASDFSTNALNFVRTHLTESNREKVSLHCCEARDFSKYKGQTFDLILLNSVLQCFPNVDYLIDTIEAALQHLNPGGVLFLGDVRNYDLLGAFSTSIELHQHDTHPDTSLLRELVMARVAKDGELLIAPEFIRQLQQQFPQIEAVEVIPKYDLSGAGIRNELFDYRFDALLYVGGSDCTERTADAQTVPWTSNLGSAEEFRQQVDSIGPRGRVIRIPDTRLSADIQMYDKLLSHDDTIASGDSDTLLQKTTSSRRALSLSDYIKLARESGFNAEASLLNEQPGFVTLNLWRDGERPVQAESHINVSRGTDRLLCSDPGRLTKENEFRQNLGNYLSEKLPEFMIPSAVILLPAIPLTSNGKVDRAKLPAPDSSSYIHEVYIPPRNEREQMLAELWKLTLGINQVGILDNFFALGGDSILSIQLVARAREQGLGLTSRQILEFPTIETLAESLPSETRASVSGSLDKSAYALPLRSLIGQNEDALRQSWRTVLFELPQNGSVDFANRFIQAAYRNHDALRQRIFVSEEAYVTRFLPLTKVIRPLGSFECDYTLQALQDDPSVIAELVSEATEAAPASDGVNAFQARLWSTSQCSSQYLILSSHKLAIDRASISVLINDYERAVERWEAGRDVDISIKRFSYRHWLDSVKATTDVHYSPRKADDQEVLHSGCNPRAQRKLKGFNRLKEIGVQSYGVTPSEVLASAVGQELRANNNDFQLDVIASYREGGALHAASTNTMDHAVGSLLAVQSVDSGRLGDHETLIKSAFEEKATLLVAVKEMLRSGKGRELAVANDSDATRVIVDWTDDVSNITLNRHLAGVFDPSCGGGWLVSNSHPLAISVSTINNEAVLSVVGDSRIFKQQDIDELCQNVEIRLTDLIDHCATLTSRQFTPGDFPFTDISQHRIELLQSRYPALENLYDATPLQTGLIFHSERDKHRHNGSYIVQVILQIEENVDEDRFRQVWNHVGSRYDVFRSAFEGFGNEQITQFVLSNVELPWASEDWRNRDAQTQQDDFNALCVKDKHEAFDLATPPLMRFHLIRTRDDRYKFLWTYHHSLVDGWSMAVVLREVSHAYSNGGNDFASVLSPAAPYTRYLGWLRTRDQQSASAYWAKELADIDSRTQLLIHSDQPNVAKGEPNSSDVYMSKLSSTETAAVEAFAKHNQLTVNVLVLASWLVLMSRYSGHTTVVTGQATSGRQGDVEDVDQMVGLLIHTVPVRAKVSIGHRIKKWLSKLHQQSVLREEYGYLSLKDIQQRSAVPNSEQMFDTLLAFVNYPMDQAELEYDITGSTPGDSVAPANTPGNVLPVSLIKSNESTNYDLTLVVIPARQLTFKMNYHTAQYSQESVANMMDHLLSLLRGIVSGDFNTVGELPMLTEKELRHVLRPASYSSPIEFEGVHQLFEKAARYTPDKTAIVDVTRRNLGRVYSFDCVNRRANQLARYLMRLNIGPESRVLIYQSQGVDRLISLLAVWKLGAACVPIDSDYHAYRVNTILNQCSSQLVLLDSRTRNNVDDDILRCISIDAPTVSRDVAAESSSDIDERQIRRDSIAYITYTSGSTGSPKGVMQTHQTLLNLVNAQRETVALRSDRITAQLVSISFDVSMQELATSWYHGNSLVLMDTEIRRDTASLRRILRQQYVERVFISPVLACQLFKSGVELPVREIICAGEQLTLTEEFSDYLRQARPVLLNHYGPTETHVVTTYQLNTVNTGVRAPIGTAIDNTYAYVLSDHLLPMPIGVPGELLVGGCSLARGYVDNPGATAERFIPDPFSKTPGARLYRTGDVARFVFDGATDSGVLEYIGRNDNQVKVRGNRVELGEIESYLLTQPDVAAAAVLLTENSLSDQVLCAFVVLADKSGHDALDQSAMKDIAAQRLHRHCVESLPGYLVPNDIVVVDELPLTLNGKLDRQSLPFPDRTSSVTKEFSAPVGATENALAVLWGDVLKLDHIDRNESFFNLGGHSILMMQIAERLQHQFDLHVSVTDLFERPTIRELAAYIDQLLTLINMDDFDSLSEEEASMLLMQLEAR